MKATPRRYAIVPSVCEFVCVCACVRVWVRACACVRACVCVFECSHDRSNWLLTVITDETMIRYTFYVYNQLKIRFHVIRQRCVAKSSIWRLPTQSKPSPSCQSYIRPADTLP